MSCRKMAPVNIKAVKKNILKTTIKIGALIMDAFVKTFSETLLKC